MLKHFHVEIDTRTIQMDAVASVDVPDGTSNAEAKSILAERLAHAKLKLVEEAPEPAPQAPPAE